MLIKDNLGFLYKIAGFERTARGNNRYDAIEIASGAHMTLYDCEGLTIVNVDTEREFNEGVAYVPTILLEAI